MGTAQGKVRSMAALVLQANAFKAAQFLHERLLDGRITSRSTTCVGGVFHVCLVGPRFGACGESRDSEEDALAQAAQTFSNWEYQAPIQLGVDAVDLGASCF
jgi:hypothetical protein